MDIKMLSGMWMSQPIIIKL